MTLCGSVVMFKLLSVSKLDVSQQMQAFDPIVKLLQSVIFHYFETDFCGPINSEVLKLVE